METAIIILTIIIVLLVIFCFLQNRTFKSFINNQNVVLEHNRKTTEENETTLRNQLTETYGRIGDTLHYLHYMFEKSPGKYVPLITVLGEYLRKMYITSSPFSTLSDEYDLNPEQNHLPCLDEIENKELLAFMREIKDGVRNPVDLLEFIVLITDPERDFNNAMHQTIAMTKKI